MQMGMISHSIFEIILHYISIFKFLNPYSDGNGYRSPSTTCCIYLEICLFGERYSKNAQLMSIFV